MEELEKRLRDLTTVSKEPAKAGAVLKRISHLFEDEQGCDSTIDLMINLVLGNENGIASFIQSVSSVPETDDYVVTSAFELLEFLLVNFERSCQPHVTKLQDVCIHTGEGSVSARIRVSAFKFHSQLFQPSLVHALDVSESFAAVKKCLANTGKGPYTLRTEALSLVGHIFERAPEVSEAEKDWFLDFAIRETLKVRGRKMGHNVLIGCLNVFDGYLTHFRMSESETSTVYSHLKDYCGDGHVSREVVTERIALRIVSRHHAAFAGRIAEDVRFWSKVCKRWLGKIGEDRKLGFNGMVAVYKAVALSCTPDDSEKVNSLVQDLLQDQSLTSLIGLVELVSTGLVHDERVLELILRRSKSSTSTMYLAVNLDCLSKYFAGRGSITTRDLIHMKRTAIRLIDEYPEIDAHFREDSLRTLERSFHQVSRIGRRELNEYAKDVIYQGLIRTCSHPIILQETGPGVVSYKSYLPLWIRLCNISADEVDEFGAGREVANTVLNEYLSSFLRINKSLDLRTRVTNPDSVDPGIASEAFKPTDFQLFVNNVDLFVDVVRGTEDSFLLEKWLTQLLADTLELSRSFPLVSGFYKVISVVLRTAEDVNYFQSDGQTWCLPLQRFLRSVSKQALVYTGDLRLSCCHAVLSAPGRLVEPFIDELVPMFKLVLRIDSGQFSLLTDTVDALERWFRDLPPRSMDTLLKNILPHFDLFLQSKDVGQGTRSGEFKRKPVKVRGQIRKLNRATEAITSLPTLQRKFLFFLGRLNENLRKELIRDDQARDFRFARLHYDMPLADSTLRLNLGQILPRVTELSLSSRDRSTRVTACELLHSAVLITLGNMRRTSDEFMSVFRRLLPVSLSLGCDSDGVVRQMFEPLACQIVRYYADAGTECPGSDVLVDCLAESVSHPYNSSLRDFAAELIRLLATRSESYVRGLLRCVYSLSVNPDVNRRSGAAVIFNNVRSLVQSDTNMLSTEWFLLYYHFMQSIDMSSHVDDTTHTMRAVAHIKTALLEEGVLREASPFRKIPPGFGGGSLADLVKWTFSCCSSPHPKLRKLSMSLVEDLSGLTSPIRDLAKSHGFVRPRVLKSTPDEDEYAHWLTHVAGVFHYNAWLLRCDAGTIEDALTIGVKSAIEDFVSEMLRPRYHSVSVASAIASALDLVSVCLSLRIQPSFHHSVLDMIKTCVYLPGRFDFDVEELQTALSKVLPAVAVGLPEDDLKYFLDGEEFLVDLRDLTDVLRSRKPRNSVRGALAGLEMIRKHSLWDRQGCTLSGEQLLSAVYECLFKNKGNRRYAVAMDPNDKALLRDVIRLGLTVGVSPSSVTELIARTALIVEEETLQSSTEGSYFFDVFRTEILDYFLTRPEECMDACTPQLILDLVKHSQTSTQPAEVRDTLVRSVFQKWKTFVGSPGLLLSIVLAGCRTNSKALIQERELSQWVMSQWSAMELELLLEMLPYFSEPNESLNPDLATALCSLRRDTVEDARRRVLVGGFVDAFAKTRSIPVLEEVVKEGSLTDDSEKKLIDAIVVCESEHIEKVLLFLFHSRSPGNPCERLLNGVLSMCSEDLAKKFLGEHLEALLQAVEGEDIQKVVSAVEVIRSGIVRMTREDVMSLPEPKIKALKGLILCLKTSLRSRSNGEDPELRRKSACAFFNALCAVLSVVTYDNPAAFETHVFGTDFPFLPRLIDSRKTYRLGMEFDKLPKRQKVMAALRRDVTRERRGPIAGSIRYVREQTLFESSLKEDVTKFDFFTSFVRPMNESDVVIELEMDVVSEHECMATLVGVIQRISSREAPFGTKVPPWLASLISRMTSYDSSVNEKIFLLKLLYNVEECIRPYGCHVVFPIIDTLDICFDSTTINYLIFDLVTALLRWNIDLTRCHTQLKSSLTRLLLCIVDGSNSYRREIIKSNLELVKLIVETCKDVLVVDRLSAKAFGSLKEMHDYSTDYVNLSFCGILLANSIRAWPTDDEEETFLRAVLRRLSYGDKNGILAAEIAGLTLKWAQENGRPASEHLLSVVCDKIRGIDADDMKNVPFICAVHGHYPAIGSRFLRSVQTFAWRLSGRTRVESLHVLRDHVTRLEKPVGRTDFPNATTSSFLCDMLASDDSEVVAITLQIVDSLLDKVDARMNGAKEVVERGLQLGECKSPAVRRAVYGIAERLYRRDWDIHLGADVRERCKAVLLNGMNDDDVELREKCLRFWCETSTAPTLTERFSRILYHVYAPGLSGAFASFATRIVIRSAATEYASPIFDYSLGVDSGIVRKRHIFKTPHSSTPAPMFAQTLARPDVAGTVSSSKKVGIRFVKNTASISRAHFSRRVTEKRREAEVAEERKRVEALDVLREYSDGDFPDIQIGHGEVLLPLEALARKDPQIGLRFLSSVYDGLARGLSDRACDEIDRFIRQVMEKDAGTDPTVVAFVFHVLLNCDGRFEAEPELVAKCAKSSGWLSVGGLVIEEMITRKEANDAEPERKRIKRDVNDMERRWLCLADLCRSLDETQVVRGIFLDKLGVDGDAAEAIRAHSVSDWSRASRLFESVLATDSVKNNLHVGAYFESLAHLSDWSKLNECIRDTYILDDLWSDSELRGKVLPWFVRSAVMTSLASGQNVVPDVIQERETDLRSRFAEDLAMAYFAAGDVHRSRHYIRSVCRDFLSDWPHRSKWSGHVRVDRLARLQLISELEHCLASDTDDLVRFWHVRQPRDSDDLMNWDMCLSCRRCFLSDTDALALSELRLAAAGIVQKNTHLAEVYLSRAICAEQFPPLRLLRLCYKTSLALLRMQTSKTLEIRDLVDASKELLQGLASTTNSENHPHVFMELSMVMRVLAQAAEGLDDAQAEYLTTQLNISKGNLVENLQRKDLEYLEEARRSAGKRELSVPQSQVYLEIVKHYRKRGYCSELVKCLFRSMKLGHSEARELFCSLLEEPDLARDWASDGEIRDSCGEVPAWMFLKWTSQLLARLDSDLFPFVSNVLLRVADEYPNAIRLPFALSCELYLFSDPERRHFTDTLSRKLCDPFHERFVVALSYVTPPDMVARHFFGKVIAEVTRSSWDEAKHIVKAFFAFAYGDEFRDVRGPIWECLSQVKQSVGDLLHLENDIRLWKGRIGEIVEAISQMDPRHGLLKSYTPGLHSLHSTALEIPGQYDGEDRPVPKHHVTISSFKYGVTSIKSKCKPIRIVMVGNDGREYGFLLKFGEDLRQDERLQQVFRHMNHVLATSSLSVDTYKVIPIRGDLGLVQWIDDTSSLLELLARADPKVFAVAERVQTRHLEFLARGSRVADPVAAHLNGYLTVTSDEAVSRFSEAVNSFPTRLLRNSFWILSATPEEFVHLRRSFAASHAVACIAHWLVGIGDRHLDNVLVSVRTGRVLGIDFGSAFGFATEFLSPPELVPFRLSPQVVELMAPMRTSGLVKETMIRCLRSFRDNHDVLVAMLEAFALEPALDWLEKARRVNESRVGAGAAWSPRRKVEAVVRKLKGVDPVRVLREDLVAGHSQSPCLQKYLGLLDEVAGESTGEVLTVEDQVESLIRLATDRRVLAMTYVGWNPWL